MSERIDDSIIHATRLIAEKLRNDALVLRREAAEKEQLANTLTFCVSKARSLQDRMDIVITARGEQEEI